jgi:ParB family chromosome partitioning protein
MTTTEILHEKVVSIRIDEIYVLNPRSRNKRVFAEIVDNIRKVGLKRPITVRRRTKDSPKGDDAHRYDLICGQGRMEACKALGHVEIPAFVTDVNLEDAMLMSLVENLARRQHHPMEQMREIGRLRDRGHTTVEIADRLGVTSSWVLMVTGLLDHGEERLLTAVETGAIPISLAVDIARSGEAELQNLLADAYAQGLRGKKLTVLRRLLDQRSKHGPNDATRFAGLGPAKKKKMTPGDLRRLFEKEASKQRIAVKKASIVQNKLNFLTYSFKDLLANDEFKEILKRGRDLKKVPTVLMARIENAGGSL